MCPAVPTPRRLAGPARARQTDAGRQEGATVADSAEVRDRTEWGSGERAGVFMEQLA